MAGPTQPPFVVPRGEVPPNWGVIPKISGTLRLLTQATPFRRLWRWDHVPEPVWQGNPVPSNIEFLPPPLDAQAPAPVVVPSPAPPTNWQWTPPRDIPLLSVSAAPFAKLWRYDYVPSPDWLGAPDGSNFNLLGGRVPTKQWRYDHVPEPVWTWTAPRSNTLTLGVPFSKLWRYDYVPPPDWLGAPVSSNFNILGGQVPTKLWRWDHVPEPVWTWQAPPSNTLRSLTAAKPFFRLWRYDLVPPTDWLGAPVAGNNLLLSSIPPFHRLWRYDFVPPAEWVWRPPMSVSIFSATEKPFSRLWDYQHVPEPVWLGRPRSSPFWLRPRFPFRSGTAHGSMIYGDYNIATAPYATFPPGSFTRSLRWRAILRQTVPDALTLRRPPDWVIREIEEEDEIAMIIASSF